MNIMMQSETKYDDQPSSTYQLVLNLSWIHQPYLTSLIQFNRTYHFPPIAPPSTPELFIGLDKEDLKCQGLKLQHQFRSLPRSLPFPDVHYSFLDGDKPPPGEICLACLCVSHGSMTCPQERRPFQTALDSPSNPAPAALPLPLNGPVLPPLFMNAPAPAALPLPVNGSASAVSPDLPMNGPVTLVNPVSTPNHWTDLYPSQNPRSSHVPTVIQGDSLPHVTGMQPAAYHLTVKKPYTCTPPPISASAFWKPQTAHRSCPFIPHGSQRWPITISSTTSHRSPSPKPGPVPPTIHGPTSENFLPYQVPQEPVDPSVTRSEMEYRSMMFSGIAQLFTSSNP
ncbi:hypothetical protein GYMLUDRAFT_54857 [Collybiopsis luxurians FD-317 M1]|nr:hypothetical protein GYMLUDRAFT_54857 [Collybiopsis luxurians FD-317 M1]